MLHDIAGFDNADDFTPILAFLAKVSLARSSTDPVDDYKQQCKDKPPEQRNKPAPFDMIDRALRNNRFKP